MCLMAGHNGLPVTENQLKEMEENRERKERREEGDGHGRKRAVKRTMRRKTENSYPNHMRWRWL